MDKFSLIMVLHSHQPVGNFPKVFAWAVEQCYRPVLELLARYPEFKVGLHYSGPLLSWLAENDPEFLEQLAAMTQAGQVELLGGGYYEPLLAVIPTRDAVAQLQMQNRFTEERFGRPPRGFWLAERIWEPGLPAKLAPAGLAYTLVDDTHFYYAGLEAGDMFGYRVTEREGHPLALFPTHKHLRYTIPFQSPQVTLDFLKSALDQHGPTAATYGDDCEKFGLWPKTHDWVFGKKWLERFVEAVLANGDWLRTEHPSSFMDRNPPRGRVYLPTASYEEMLTWALPAKVSRDLEDIQHELEREGRLESMRRFLRGGQWDNFLVKYRESNLMHKRMLWVSAKLESPAAHPEAYDHLLQAQCNCAYWHGLFGGLYLCHLRQAVHQHLIAAESLLDQAAHGPGPWASATLADLDVDGQDEVILASPVLDLVVHPALGGAAQPLNLRGPQANLADTLTRRFESYHAHFDREPASAQTPVAENESGIASAHDLVVFKEEGLKDHLIYDWYHRAVFQEHILAPWVEPAAYQKPDYGEWGDFIDQPFTVDQVEPGGLGRTAGCRLSRAGQIWAPGGPYPLTMTKTYTLSPGGELAVRWTLDSERDDTPACRLAVELNLTMLTTEDPGRQLWVAAEQWALDQSRQVRGASIAHLVSQDQGYDLEIRLGGPAEAWHFPVETVSQSESGLERTYQGSSLSFVWPLPAGAGRAEFSLLLRPRPA